LEYPAVAWGKDAKLLNRRLRDHHTGLPRGRIVHPKVAYVVIHSDDAPAAVPDWLNLVKARCPVPTHRGRSQSEFTEHEKILADDPNAVQAALGISLYLKTTA
jgi:hypothetical protein